MGAYHTIDLQLNQKFTLAKSHWDYVSFDRLGEPLVDRCIVVVVVVVVAVMHYYFLNYYSSNKKDPALWAVFGYPLASCSSNLFSLL